MRRSNSEEQKTNFQPLRAISRSDEVRRQDFDFSLQKAHHEGEKKKEKKQQQQEEEHDPDDSYTSNMGSNLCTSDDKEPGSENNPYRTEEEVSF